jgi:ABC-type lipoprotein export system ATPase subunit
MMLRESDTEAVPRLEVTGVELSYRLPGGELLHVLRGVDLAVGDGELLCLAGRSGSGKSSLLYVASGLLAPDNGVVRWLGEDITRLTAAEVAQRRRHTVGFVFQTGGLVDLLTAAENVALPGLADGRDYGDSLDRGDVRARVVSLLDQFDLSQRARHFPAQLSGGERQRIAVARALFADPPVLIIDEPTASLDAASAEHMVELLRKICDTGRAVLVASHDEHVIRGADRLVHLD